MRLPILTLILATVAMICGGQLLFKLVGLRLQQGVPPLDFRVLSITLLSFAIYGLATLLWIYVLKSTPLTTAYPYMALCFVVVPLASVFFFSEQVRPMYFVGTALVVVGVLVTSLSTLPGR